MLVQILKDSGDVGDEKEFNISEDLLNIDTFADFFYVNKQFNDEMSEYIDCDDYKRRQFNVMKFLIEVHDITGEFQVKQGWITNFHFDILLKHYLGIDTYKEWL